MLNIIKWLVPGAVLARLSLGYLDPGSGSFIIQILVAGFLGMMFSVKLFWHRIKRFFKRSNSVVDAPEDQG